MGALLQFRESQLCPTVESAVIRVPKGGDSVHCDCADGRCAREQCRGFVPSGLPMDAHRLEQHLTELGERFIARMAVRGFDHVGTTLWAHGPFPRWKEDGAVDLNDSRWTEALRPDRNGDQHPELTLPIVFERRDDPEFVNYYLIGHFLRDERFTVTRNLATSDRSPVQNLGIQPGVTR